MLKDFLNDSTISLQNPETSTNYQNQEGFPHIVIDNFLLPEQAEQAWQAFPEVNDEIWTNWLHYNEKKYGLTKREAIPDPIGSIIDQLNSKEFVSWLSDVTGIKNLIADTNLEGGGLHQTPHGGFLNIHADFTAHPHKRHWRRRVNVLIYMNKDWKPEYGGQLELWTRDMKRSFNKIIPLFNRCVIFNTDKDTFHGHPDPLTCPEGMTRRSIALYYFTEEKLPLKNATNYQARPNDSLVKSVLIFLDKNLLSVYNAVKGILGINDEFVSKMLKFISRK